MNFKFQNNSKISLYILFWLFIKKQVSQKMFSKLKLSLMYVEKEYSTFNNLLYKENTATK